jgi:hypothetical protein
VCSPFKLLHEFSKSPHVLIEPSALRAAKALIHAVADYAVDGNTDGEFLNSSTTHTKDEQGAWWQVDLGSKKNINEIIILDCVAGFPSARL